MEGRVPLLIHNKTTKPFEQTPTTNTLSKFYLYPTFVYICFSGRSVNNDSSLIAV